MTDPVLLLRDLIRCRSVTPLEGGALGVLDAVLKSAGFTTHRVTFSESGTADIENFYARIGTTAPHFTFAGHTDVVPAGDEAAWTQPPFNGNTTDGFLYGRGAVDMKGGIACAVAAVLDHLGGRAPPKGSISFLITGDEEGIAVNGTVKLLKWVAERGEKFDHCIVAEPSSAAALGDGIKIGRRGSLSGTLKIEGKQGHVAYPERADNPVPGLVRIVNALMAEPLDNGSDHFQPSNLEFTSLDVGNQAVNVIPMRAQASFNIRYNDNHTQTSLRALIEARAAQAAGNSVKWTIDWIPSNADAFLTEPGAFTGHLVAAIHDVTGVEPKLNTLGGTSDARFITHACPVLEFGLVGQTMHQVDERVAISDLARLTAIYRNFLDRYFA
jgi:succinyl-diaminopimelate desuccinylase